MAAVVPVPPMPVARLSLDRRCRKYIQFTGVRNRSLNPLRQDVPGLRDTGSKQVVKRRRVASIDAVVGRLSPPRARKLNLFSYILKF